MIEKTVLDYLNDKLPVPVYMEVPEDVETSYVIIEKTGGGMTNQIWTATLAIKSVAASLFNAAALNIAVIEAMLAIADTTEISKCSLNSNYNFTDTRTKEYRYQAVFDIVYF